MSSVLDVAKYVLSKCGSLSTLKLQKLCYYSQAWSLVWDDVPLFEESFEAWANGPVCPRLYSEHRGHFQVEADQIPGNSDKLNKTQIETVESVLSHYGNMSSYELSTLTHNEKPWKVARQGLAPGESGDEQITFEAMAEYYSSLV